MKRLAFSLACTAVLAGCATLSEDGGLNEVAQLTRERTGHAPAAARDDAARQKLRERVDALLAQPLSADGAVELALLNNRGLQARLAGLGVVEAEAVRAGRLPNPMLHFGRISGGGDVEIERGLSFNLLALLTLPTATRLGQERFAQARVQAAADAVALADETRRAWVEAVASAELLAYSRQVQEAADVAAELARRMRQAGHFSRLAQMREQAFLADAAAQLARAQHQALADRERLTRLLGLHGEQLAFRLPDRLPPLPAEPLTPQTAERTALEQRLDVRAARLEAESTARSLDLTKSTRFINVLELGYQNRSETGLPRANGWEVGLELPLFDFGGTRAARAEAQYMQAVHRTAEVAIQARSEVRESYSAYRTAHDLARHYRDEVVPLRKRIAEENLLRYNGMLIGVFELLADARDQVSSVTAAVQSLRDFWVADARLRSALTGRSPGAATLSAPAAAAPAAADRH